jgi:trans-aconitate methyltransferase
MSKIQWDSQLYLRCERERTQPSTDLASRIDLDSPAAIIDLGCGPGNSTRVLRERWKSHRLSDRYTLRTHTPGEYYDWLAPLSKQLQIWETVYFHELANHEAIVDFYSSTGLKPYLEGCHRPN